MTKAELQGGLAEATSTDKKAVGVSLHASRLIVSKAVKKEGEFILPGFGNLAKQKRAARMGLNPRLRPNVNVAAKTEVKDAIVGVRVSSRSWAERKERRRRQACRG